MTSITDPVNLKEERRLSGIPQPKVTVQLALTRILADDPDPLVALKRVDVDRRTDRHVADEPKPRVIWNRDVVTTIKLQGLARNPSIRPDRVRGFDLARRSLDSVMSPHSVSNRLPRGLIETPQSHLRLSAGCREHQTNKTAANQSHG